MSGWTSFITGSSAPFAAIAIGMSEYMLEALPAIATDQTILGFSGTLFLKKGIAVLTILIFTFIHLQGVKSGSKIHNVLTVLKILLILGIIISAFSLGEGSFSHFKYSESYDFNLQGIKI